MDKKTFVEVQILQRGSNTLLELKNKNKNLDILEWVRGILPVSRLPTKQYSWKLQEAGDLAHGGKGRAMSECSASPAVQDTTKETHLSPEVIQWDLNDWEPGGY